MSVVRIPLPDEDAFPWPQVVGAVVLGGALGLGFAYWGMERDRASESATVDTGETPTIPEPVAEPSVTEPSTAATGSEAPTPDAPELEPQALPEIVPEADAIGAAQPSEAPSTPEPDPREDGEAEPEPPVAAAPTPTVPTPTPTVPTPTVPTPTVPTGPVHLVPGRVAYLRCVGVPQHPGPFPCPRDEALEAAVWAALTRVETCASPPVAGQADIVIDLAGHDAAPTIRARDTFAPDVVRADAAALLACSADSLANVRTSLSPTRLVISFRLSLASGAR